MSGVRKEKVMADCERYASDLSELFTGGLSDDRRREVEGHLAGCPECRRLREELGRLFEAGELSLPRVERLSSEIGRERFVIDLSCRRVEDGWRVATDRWQTLTEDFDLIVGLT